MTTTRRFGALMAGLVLAACGRQEVRLQQLQISPVVTEVTENLQADVVATAVYSDGSTEDVTAQVEWSTEDAAIAGLPAAGRVQGGAPGRTYLAASYAGLKTTARVDVLAATLLFLQVRTAAASLPSGLTTRATVLGTFSDGSVRDVTAAVVWSVNGAAQVRADGLVKALAPGRAQVLASIGDTASSALLEMTEATARSLSVSLQEAPLPLGLRVGVQVLATFTDGTTRDVTADATLGVGDGTLASLQGSTLVGLVAGLTELTASLGDLVATTPVTVTEAAVQSIALEASSQDVHAGNLLYFTATATLTDGTTRSLTRQVTWTSSLPQVAIISNDIEPGAVLAFTPGTATITALDGASRVSATYELVVSP
jgi:hypothetical protein